ncbi:MAG: G8 domain-containing protein [Planctomycetota bacterium]
MVCRSSRLGFETLESRNLLSVTTAVQSGAWDDVSTWDASVPDNTLRAIIPTGLTVTLAGTDHTASELVIHGVLNVAEGTGADFDGSGLIDGSDFLAWQRGEGDADGDSDSDSLDLNLWQTQFGTSVSGNAQTKSLTTDWIHVNSGGVFQIGTESNRYDANDFVVTLTGTDQNADHTVETATGTMQISDNGGFLMAAMGGRLQFFGQDKLGFTKLGQTAEVGANSIVVENVIERNFDGTTSAASDGELNWELGDQIVIASSSRDYSDQEVRTITAITDLGNGTARLTLDIELGNRHYGEIETYDNGSRSIDLRSEVALLSRNVRIQGLASQDTDSSWGNRALFNTASNGDHRGISGHIMIMGTAGQISVEGVQLDRLGQTGTLGRYPIHWHLAGDRTGDVLKSVSVTNSNNRGVTVHGTDNLLIQDVVLHDIHGHGFFMEDGVETGNTFLSNIAFGVHKVGRSDAVGNNQPDGNDPFIVDTHDFVAQNPNRFLSSSGYWITNPDNTWVGNISAGVDGTGFWFILPEFALGASAGDPQYANVNANETPLGLFDHNTSHSSHVGFNMDRGMDLESPVGATLLNNSFGRAYQPQNSSGQQVEPVFSNFTAYKHEVGVYQRGRYGRFHQNAYADNFTSTFITFSQRITDSLYIGHSLGNANLNDVVTGQSLYDGPNSMDGTHFAGFNRGANAHVFRNHGGALRNTHVYIGDTSYEDDGTKEQLSISERNGQTYSASRDAFDFQAPTAIYDVDGTLTGHGGGAAGSVLLPDNNFLIDSNDVRPSGWDAWISDDLYANFRLEFNDNNQGRLTLVTPDGDSDTESQDNSHRTILKANDAIYNIAFPDGVSSYGDGFDILYRIQLGSTNPTTITESSIIRFQGIANSLQVLRMNNIYNGSQSTPTTQVASFFELETLPGPGYLVDGNDLVVKFVTSSSEAIRYRFTPGSSTPIDPPLNDGLLLSAVEDAYIQNSTTVDDTLLRIESSGSRTRTSYLKFDVPDTAEMIIGATLQLTVSGDAGNNMRIRLYEGGSDNWTEATLSPANAPAKATLLDEVSGDLVIGQTYVFDVSEAVDSGEQVTFVVDSDGAASGGDAAFASNENASAAIRPLLIVELEDTSEPMALTLWEDTSPPDNADGSAVSKISDPFGTNMGDIGRWITNGKDQYHNINPAGPVLDVSGYDGWDYSFSFDYYVDSTQPLSDDTVYLNAGYGASNWTTINSGAVLDSWTTVTATGTIDAFAGSSVNPLIIVNHKNTTEATPSFYIDNIQFSVNSPTLGGIAAASKSTAPLEVAGLLDSLSSVVDDSRETQRSEVQSEVLSIDHDTRHSYRDAALATFDHEAVDVATLASNMIAEDGERQLPVDLSDELFG